MEMQRIVINTYKPQGKQSQAVKQTEKKLRVAAYCRVSTDKEEQQLSFATQCEVYEDMIKSNPDWELAGVYSDEGITGTSTKKRKGFQKMVEDCEAGKIDFVITKSISRFARNTLDCLTTIRYLQSLGVQFLFEKERIDTRAAFSEMLLTIMAAFAQEESRSLSENLKWGIRKRFESGQDRWVTCYGYRSIDGVDYVIDPDEAEVIRLIFDLYQHGMKTKAIVEYLMEHKIPSPKGNEKWLSSAIYDIIRNEKYAGDIILQKKYTVDHLSHRQLKNDGITVPAYYIKDHHNPIVSREVFNQVNRIRQMRYQGGGRDDMGKPVLYPFGEMLKCPHCGGTLIRRHLPIQNREVSWVCEGKGNCKNFIFREWAIKDSLLKAYSEVDMEAVARKASVKNEKVSSQAKQLLDMKSKHPQFDSVEYFWLDDLIDKIEIGTHLYNPKNKETFKHPDDRFITVYWKCGVKTTVFSGIRLLADEPRHIAELYKAYYKRHHKRPPSVQTGALDMRKLQIAS